MKHQYALFVLSLMLLLSVVFTGCVAVLPEAVESEAAAPAPESVTGSEAIADSSFYADNPELLVASRYTAIVEDEAKTGSAFYAANPEMMVAGRYENIGEDETGTEIGFYAANPELMIAERYAAAQEEKLRLQRIYFPGR